MRVKLTAIMYIRSKACLDGLCYNTTSLIRKGWLGISMGNVRIGIIGLGNMGSSHALELIKNEVTGGQLTAVCDSRPERLQWAKENLGDQVLLFADLDAFFNCNSIDGVIV